MINKLTYELPAFQECRVEHHNSLVKKLMQPALN